MLLAEGSDATLNFLSISGNALGLGVNQLIRFHR